MTHSVSINHPIGRRGCLFHSNRRKVEELVQDRRRHRLRRAPLRLVELCPVELGGANLLGAGAKRGDRRDDIQRRLPFAEPLCLSGNDRLRTLGFAATPGEGLGNHGLDIVDVVEVATVELVDRRVEIARDGEVDQEQRPALASWQDTLDLHALENPSGSARRRDDDVRGGELLFDLVETDRVTAEASRELGTSIGAPIRDPGNCRAARDEVSRGEIPDLAGPDDENVAIAKVTEHLLRKRGSCRRD